MPRTKRRFEDVSASSQRNKSQPEAEPLPEEAVNEERPDPPTDAPVSRGGGKMFLLQRPGKQIRTIVEQDDDSDDEEDDEEEEEEEEDTNPPVHRGGKYFRPVGGKQLNVPPGADASSEEEEEEEDDDEEEEVEPVAPPSRSAGKSLMNMQRGGGKQFRPPFPVQDDDDDDDDEDEEDSENETEEPNAVRLGSGKMFAPVKPTVQKNSSTQEEAEDMDLDSEEDTKKDVAATKVNTTESKVAESKATTKKPTKPKQSTANKTKEAKKTASVTKSKPPPPKKPAVKKRVVLEELDDDEDDDAFDNDLSKDDKQEPEIEDMDPEDLQEHHLIQGEADQKYLDSLPELEREEILAERYEKRKNELEMKKVLREQRQREQELKSSSTGKGGSNKIASKKLSNSAKKTTSARESSLSAPKSTQKDKKAAARAVIRETRAASKNIAQKKRIAQAEEDEASDLDYGSEDNDDSDEDYDEKPWAMKKATEVIKESSKVASSRKDSDDMEVDDKNEESPMAVSRTFVEADYADYKMVIIPRRRLIRWCHEPFFDKAVENYYVRIMIGNDPMTQKPLYKLSKIMKVAPKENMEYEFPAEPGKPPVKTNKYLSLIIGVSPKDMPMSRVSDSPLLPSEFQDYVNYLKNNRLQAELLSKKEASKMKDVQEKLVTNYHYTEQDIDEAVKAKKALTTTVANIGGEKMRAALAVQAAQQNVDESRSKVDEITKNFLEVFDDREKTALEEELRKEKKSLSEKLLTLQKCMEEEKKILTAEESRKNRMKQSTKIQNWVKVNERAKAANKNADVEAYKIELERMSLGGKEKEFDPFARRKVRPQILWDVGKDKSKDNDQNLENADAKKSEGAGLPDADKAESKNSGPHDPTETTIGQAAKNPKLKNSDDLHDLAIDEELIARSNIQQGIGHSNKGSSLLGRVRKGLSLDEYLMKKAAGTL